MKKNVMMRVAALLLVCVMATTCGISGTFAKYVSEKSNTASARVAKWGVEFVTASDNLFKPEYDYKTQPTGVVGTLSVKADTDVVAPGTSGSGYTFTTNHPMGNPEVSYVVTFVAEAGYETIFVDTYFPVEFTLTLDGNDVVVSKDLGVIMTTLAQCQYMFDVSEGKYYVSDDGGATWTYTANVPVLELSWNWEFYVNADCDTNDTKLGNLAAGYTLAQVGATAANLEIAFTIVATATQID